MGEQPGRYLFCFKRDNGISTYSLQNRFVLVSEPEEHSAQEEDITWDVSELEDEDTGRVIHSADCTHSDCEAIDTSVDIEASEAHVEHTAAHVDYDTEYSGDDVSLEFDDADIPDAAEDL